MVVAALWQYILRDKLIEKDWIRRVILVFALQSGCQNKNKKSNQTQVHKDNREINRLHSVADEKGVYYEIK